MRDTSRGTPPEPDPRTLSRLRAALTATCRIMDQTLRGRAMGGPIAVHALFGNAIVTPNDSNLLAMGNAGHPLHGLLAGSAGHAVSARLNNYPATEGEAADTFILNDPFVAGLTASDVRLVRPVRSGGQTVAMLVSSARWTDLAQAAPGIDIRTTESVQEGLRLPPVRLAAHGHIDPELSAVLLSNSRLPQYCFADLQAQIAALTAGEAQLQSAIDRIGRAAFQAGCVALLSRSAAFADRSFALLPPASKVVRALVPVPGEANRRVGIAMAGSIRNGRFSIDLSESDPPVDAPINCAPGTTLAALHLALLRRYPRLGRDAGSSAVINAKVDRATVVAATPPAPVSWCGETARTIVAMAEALFHRLSGGSEEPVAGQSCVIQLRGRSRSDIPTVETWRIPGGNGARAGTETTPIPLMEHVAAPDIERLEHALQIRFETLTAATDTAGPGANPGETGMACAFMPEVRPIVTSVLVAPACLPEDSAATENLGRAATVGSSEASLSTVIQSERAFGVEPGKQLSVFSGAGNGQGPCVDRDRMDVIRDIRDGLLTPKTATELYEVDARDAHDALDIPLRELDEAVE